GARPAPRPRRRRRAARGVGAAGGRAVVRVRHARARPPRRVRRVGRGAALARPLARAPERARRGARGADRRGDGDAAARDAAGARPGPRAHRHRRGPVRLPDAGAADVLLRPRPQPPARRPEAVLRPPRRAPVLQRRHRHPHPHRVPLPRLRRGRRGHDGPGRDAAVPLPPVRHARVPRRGRVAGPVRVARGRPPRTSGPAARRRRRRDERAAPRRDPCEGTAEGSPPPGGLSSRAMRVSTTDHGPRTTNDRPRRAGARWSVLLALLTAWLPAVPAAAQPAEALSDSAAVSLLTMLPGEEVYSAFGHSAFRIHDPALGLDRTYNFGT